MGIIAANLFLTLDGVYQAPGGPDEDDEDGFPFGGWQAPLLDDDTGDDVSEGVGRVDALLLGRKTYDIWAAYWPTTGADSPIGEAFNRVPKYVVSSTLTEPAWAGTTVLPDAAAAGRLRDRHTEIHTWGSGVLLQSLLAADAVDRLNLWLYPITLGVGKRVFGPGTVPARFRLARPARGTGEGGVSLVYERAGEVTTGDMTPGGDRG